MGLQYGTSQVGGVKPAESQSKKAPGCHASDSTEKQREAVSIVISLSSGFISIS